VADCVGKRFGKFIEYSNAERPHESGDTDTRNGELNMGGFKIAMLVMIALFAGGWLIYIWRMTHRITVRANGHKPTFNKLDEAASFIYHELRMVQSNRYKLAPLDEDAGFLNIKVVNDKKVVSEFSFTGPELMIALLCKRVRESEVYQELNS
jgi:hypothetical protein